MKLFKNLPISAITGALSVLLCLAAMTSGGSSTVQADPNWDSAPAHAAAVSGTADV
ncbi:hypothetical protein O1L60_03925 [Streptomyces diastatochromogenes]|nr:hypothetical protein [Streptomyces diastatochromogenes]